MTYEEARQMVIDNGFEDVTLFKGEDYADALIGISEDNRAVYDYDKMVDCLMIKEHWCYDDAVEWIENNTIGAYFTNKPIIMYPLRRM